MDNKKKTGNKPIKKIRLWPVTISVWENSTKEGGTFNTFSFERTYKDDEGKWQNTQSMRRQDLLVLAKACEQAFTETERQELQKEA